MRELLVAIRNFISLWILTALIYPFFILFVSQTVFPNAANGSLITNSQQQVIGSRLIGQTFTSESYFLSRPSTTNYSQGKDAAPTGISGASNLAPSNPELIKRIQDDAKKLANQGIQPTGDLVYTSGSSLDPHISVESAIAQLPKVAKARSLSVDKIRPLITENTEGRFLGIFGEPAVNVLQLNIALDNLK